MTTLSIQPPFPLITDIDGQPLEDGYIWIGVANLPPIGNPIAVYWDAALTQPAALPVRTRGGYPVNNGTPARLYVGSDYSIQVQNKNGSVIYSAPAATERYSGVVVEISSTDVSFLQAGTGAVTRTAQSKMREVVSVKDFGAVGDGVTDDTVAINTAVATLTSNSMLFFPPGNYVYKGGVNGMQLTGLSNVDVLADGTQITFGVNARFMTILNCTGIKVHGFKLKGTFSNTQRYVGNEEQGRIVTQTSSDVEMFDNRWEDTASALFYQTGSDNINFHHNSLIRTHAGVQTSSAVFSNLFITNNYFLGHVYQTVDVGSDDQIAIFGNASGQVIISENIINKQGPTAYNQARAINIDVGSGNNSEIIVSGNVVSNVATTTAAACRGAIFIEGATASRLLKKVNVTDNILINCDAPIIANVYASLLNISGNQIDGANSVPGAPISTGRGIFMNAGGLDYESIVSGNIIQNTASHGIEIASSNRVLISGNYIKASATRGIAIDGGSNFDINSNICVGNQDGIFVNNSQLLSIVGNNCISNSRYGVRLQGATVSGTMTANTLSGNTTADFSDDAATSNMIVGDNYGTGTRAISGTATPGKNLRGSATFSAATTATVTFAKPEPDANYFVALGSTSNNTFWWSNKTANGFTVNCSASISGTVDWLLIR